MSGKNRRAQYLNLVIKSRKKNPSLRKSRHVNKSLCLNRCILLWYYAIPYSIKVL